MEQHWTTLQQHWASTKQTHLKDLLQDGQRNQGLVFESNDILLDLTHEKMTPETIKLLQEVAVKSQVQEKVKQMFEGQIINTTEKRAVLHTALRAAKGTQSDLKVGDMKVNEEVHSVLDRIQAFSNQVRTGQAKGFTNKQLVNLIVIGIGGSYLSIEFVHEALRSSPEGQSASAGRKLRFLANVDPVDFSRAVEGLDVEETLVLINSKTFTTAETILNAKTVKNWMLSEYKKRGHAVETTE